MHQAFLALGSNLGRREHLLAEALRLLADIPATRILAVADFIETAPQDAPPGSGPFLNTAVHLQTGLSAPELFARMLAIEEALGRKRGPAAPAIRNAPRTIDLDLLLFDDRLIHAPHLSVPHPRMHMRQFVLQPLAQIAPDAIHPVTGKTIRELLADLTHNPPPALASGGPGAPSSVVPRGGK